MNYLEKGYVSNFQILKGFSRKSIVKHDHFYDDIFDVLSVLSLFKTVKTCNNLKSCQERKKYVLIRAEIGVQAPKNQ